LFTEFTTKTLDLQQALWFIDPLGRLGENDVMPIVVGREGVTRAERHWRRSIVTTAAE
jgi:hypothetical protein